MLREAFKHGERKIKKAGEINTTGFFYLFYVYNLG